MIVDFILQILYGFHQATPPANVVSAFEQVGICSRSTRLDPYMVRREAFVDRARARLVVKELGLFRDRPRIEQAHRQLKIADINNALQRALPPPPSAPTAAPPAPPAAFYAPNVPPASLTAALMMAPPTAPTARVFPPTAPNAPNAPMMAPYAAAQTLAPLPRPAALPSLVPFFFFPFDSLFLFLFILLCFIFLLYNRTFFFNFNNATLCSAGNLQEFVFLQGTVRRL